MPGDPDQLYALASQIASEADAVRERAHTLSRNAAEVQWKSSAAETFRARVADDVRAVQHCAAGLDEAAGALRHHADAVRDRLQVLREAAERAERAAEDVVDGAKNVAEDLADGAEDLLNRIDGR